MDGMSVWSMEPWTACPFLTSALELAAAGAWGLVRTGRGCGREDADKQNPQRKPDEVPDGVDHAIASSHMLRHVD